MLNLNQKTCYKCKVNLPFSAFSKSKTRSDGLNAACRTCYRSYYQKNKDSIKARVKHNMELNKDSYVAYQSAYRLNNKEKLREYNFNYKQTDVGRAKRKAHALRRYKLSLDEYINLLEQQNHVCAICGQPEHIKHRDGRTFDLSVDHCHVTGRVRGLLCRKCNSLLAYCKEDVVILQAAVCYLQENRYDME